MQKPQLLCYPQIYLRDGGTLDDLMARFGIHVKRHAVYPNLVQLKYDQIESPMEVPLVQQCRGIILDENENWNVIAWPFDKFFNHGEPLAAELNWFSDRITVQEKLDGSLIILYNYKNRWLAATSGTPDASGKVGAENISFGELFWTTFNDLKMDTPSSIHLHTTFMFELMSPYNRIVVKYPKTAIRLIGKRDIRTGWEMPVEYHSEYNPVKHYRMRSIDQVTRTFHTMNPLQQEGYVVMDENYHRVKVKHPGYVKLHHLRSSFSVKNVLEIIRAGESSEVTASFPEWKPIFEIVKAAHEGYIIAVQNDWNQLGPRVSNGFCKHPLTTRREFAEIAKKTTHPPTMFLLLDDKVQSVRESVNNIHIDTLAEILGIKNLLIAPITVIAE